MAPWDLGEISDLNTVNTLLRYFILFVTRASMQAGNKIKRQLKLL